MRKQHLILSAIALTLTSGCASTQVTQKQLAKPQAKQVFRAAPPKKVVRRTVVPPVRKPTRPQCPPDYVYTKDQHGNYRCRSAKRAQQRTFACMPYRQMARLSKLHAAGKFNGILGLHFTLFMRKAREICAKSPLTDFDMWKVTFIYQVILPQYQGYPGVRVHKLRAHFYSRYRIPQAPKYVFQPFFQKAIAYYQCTSSLDYKIAEQLRDEYFRFKRALAATTDRRTRRTLKHKFTSRYSTVSGRMIKKHCSHHYKNLKLVATR